jgi:hypothetical protein
MLTLQEAPAEEFWSDVYRERPIAVFNRHGRWHVYLDHVYQHNVAFATGEQAIAWLVRRINDGIPGRLN